MATVSTTSPINIPLVDNQPWPAQGQWTYNDYLRLPDDGRRYEIIEAVLYVTNAPSFEHQSVEIHTLSGGEYALLGEFTADEKLDSTILAGISIVTASLFSPPAS